MCGKIAGLNFKVTLPEKQALIVSSFWGKYWKILLTKIVEVYHSEIIITNIKDLHDDVDTIDTFKSKTHIKLSNIMLIR